MPEPRTLPGWVWLAAPLVGLGGGFALFLRVPLLMPVLQALPAWGLLLLALRAGRPAAGALLMVFWALGASLAVIELTRWVPGAAEGGILHGAAYREEMFHWIRTGEGAEGDPARFIPQHLLHYGLTLTLSFLTAGLAGLLLGSVLLNYMNFYVGELVRTASAPGLASLVGWPIWSVLRVLGFILGAIAVAQIMTGPVLGRTPWNRPRLRRLLLASVALVLADMLVKGLLAPTWRGLLARAWSP